MFVVQKIHRDHTTFNEVWLRVQRLAHYPHGKNHFGLHADLVLEKEQRVLHIDPQAAGSD